MLCPRGMFACVEIVPVRAERNIGPREGAFAFRTRGKWGASKKDERGGWGMKKLLRGPKFRSARTGTLATQARVMFTSSCEGFTAPKSVRRKRSCSNKSACLHISDSTVLLHFFNCFWYVQMSECLLNRLPS